MLQDILNFIKENYSWLIIVFIAIVESIFVVLFKKRSFILYKGLFEELVPLIIEAEVQFPGHDRGKEKRDYVVNKYLEKNPYMKSQEDHIYFVLEWLLTLPSKKKGGN